MFSYLPLVIVSEYLLKRECMHKVETVLFPCKGEFLDHLSLSRLGRVVPFDLIP